MIVTGAMHFDPKMAFDFPPGAFTFSLGFLMGLGAASRVGVYDYLGYYDVCYIGDEVKDPGRVIPRSILISTIVVAADLLRHQPVDHRRGPLARVRSRGRLTRSRRSSSRFSWSASTGPASRPSFTLMMLWTAFGSVFALLLGYSRVPYAAARDGYFFAPFGRLHPTGGFPAVSLVVLGTIAIAACCVSR